VHENSSHINQNSDEDALQKFRRYWWLVRRRIWLVIILGLAGGIYKYNDIVQVREQYRSVSQIILDGSSTDRAVALLDVPGARYGYQNEMLILKSNKLSLDVARTLLNSFQKSSK
jgi:hypothetical protein